ncbi:hypothetical protein EV421DRAFT_2023448 [Armillaria borealis]|uniref:Uncharacterized protein n=1 Tax=Armillaria borealis TaxID=47425 RepID=A0AA39J117_9AGAR|nr:hypothetical protein EV421DRAFT_2023448 [Armillaria borealis]
MLACETGSPSALRETSSQRQVVRTIQCIRVRMMVIIVGVFFRRAVGKLAIEASLRIVLPYITENHWWEILLPPSNTLFFTSVEADNLLERPPILVVSVDAGPQKEAMATKDAELIIQVQSEQPGNVEASGRANNPQQRDSDDVVHLQWLYLSAPNLTVTQKVRKIVHHPKLIKSAQNMFGKAPTKFEHLISDDPVTHVEKKKDEELHARLQLKMPKLKAEVKTKAEVPVEGPLHRDSPDGIQDRVVPALLVIRGQKRSQRLFQWQLEAFSLRPERRNFGFLEHT